MADEAIASLMAPTTMLISTSIVAFISGFMLGVYSIQGYFIVSPALASERRGNIDDPLESDESDIDEDDTILDHAPNWANGKDADLRDGLRVPKPKAAKKSKKNNNKDDAQDAESKNEDAESEQEDGEDKELALTIAGAGANEECKLVLVVRTDLGMTKGKIAAQCSHATLACYKHLSAQARKAGPSSASAQLLARWERRGQAKIAVQVKSEAELLELYGRARSLSVPADVVVDAGRTQIDPGSVTVLGVGPAPKSVVDKVTGHLKLL
ncbi:hypothetical protein AAE478_005957 [Parahypoxylon ruwenzoriense]